MLQPHQQKVVEEKAQLDERLKKLSAFLDGDIYQGLDQDEKDDMRVQYNVMNILATILERRIKRFSNE